MHHQTLEKDHERESYGLSTKSAALAVREGEPIIMTRNRYWNALVLASALAFSSLAHADSLPPGAERFNFYTFSNALSPIDIPRGRTLVITDISMLSGFCVLLDGTEPKVTISATP